MAVTVPASVEAEEALLGSMFLYPDSIRMAFEQNLQPSDFFVENNRKIYQVIMALNDEKVPVDITSVTTRLSDLQALDLVGGPEYLMGLTDTAVSSTNCEYYIQTIQEKALLRKLIEVSEQIKKNSYEGQYDALQVLNDAESLILKISRDRKTSEFVDSKTAFDDAVLKIKNLNKNEGMTGIPSGFDYLDKITNGFQKSDLIIVAARPSVGKTAFALNIASNAACQGATVALFSLEMPVIQLANRMLSAKSRVISDKIRSGKGLTNQDWAAIDDARDVLSKANIFIDDSSTIKVNDIFAKCRKLKEQQGLDMVIIDYLQLIAPSASKTDSRQQEVSEISRALKGLARELDIPVIALSQLSRAVESRERDPQLSDLRESGAIEQDADIVIFLHRPKDKNEEDENAQVRDIKVIIAKHRNGAIGSLPLAFTGSVNAFDNKDFNHEDYE